MKLPRKTYDATVPSTAMGDIAFLLLIFFVILARAQDDSHIQWQPARLDKVEMAPAARASVAVAELVPPLATVVGLGMAGCVPAGISGWRSLASGTPRTSRLRGLFTVKSYHSTAPPGARTGSGFRSGGLIPRAIISGSPGSWPGAGSTWRCRRKA